MNRPLLGTHCSIAGGVDKAIDMGESLGCEAIQIFSKNQRQWRVPFPADSEIETFKEKLSRSKIKQVITHASYLINIASPRPDLLERSRAALAYELQRVAAFGLKYLVLHPGSAVGISREEGVRIAAESLDAVLGGTAAADILLETTAGQGSNLGSSVEELYDIYSRSSFRERMGICIDTAHIFEAGYNIAEKRGIDDFLNKVDKYFGLDKVKAIHFNNSKTPLGSHKDRHEHIEKGLMPLDTFRNFLAVPAFSNLPFVLETPKEDNMDEQNLAVLRRLRGDENRE